MGAGERKVGASEAGSAPARRRFVWPIGQSGKGALDSLQSQIEIRAWRQCASRAGTDAQAGIVAPPIQSDLLRLVDGADQQSYLNRQQLDVREVDLDVSR